MTPPIHAAVRRWLGRLGGWPRRLLALGLLAAAALAAALPDRGAAVPKPPRTVAVLVAAADLRAGATVDHASVRVASVAQGQAPAGVLRTVAAALGRTLGAPLRRGEPVTDVRLVGPALAAALAGSGAVAIPVRLSDVDTAALLRPGDRVDVLAVPERGEQGAARVVARDAGVMLVPPAKPNSTVDGSLIVLAAPEKTAQTLAAAAASGQLTVTLRPDG
ncbi:MAG TPA: Flp pilus assembly protein CpaB [Mycobacteriales bacterium]|jgi:Flp pilus assembly protein CpaB|nr:Flp pilus assembly protein CpaB [Mycobacteriales bacterium]